MKKILLIIIITFPLALFSQEKIDFSKQELFTLIDSMPYFEGGEESILKFFNENSQLKFVKGRTKNSFVSVNFIVAANGKVYDPKILVSPSIEIEKEIKKLLRLMNWNPGIRKGNPVNVSTNLLLNLE